MENKATQKWASIVGGIIGIALGVLVIVLAVTQPTTVDRIVSIILAICLFIGAAALILVSYLKAPTKRLFSSILLYASAMIAIGVFLCVYQLFIGEFIKIVLGVFCIAIGSCGIISGAIAIKTKALKTGWIVLVFILAAALLALGIVILVVNSEGFRTVIYCILGGLFALSGLIGLIIGIKNAVKEKKENKKDAKAVEEKKEEPKEEEKK